MARKEDEKGLVGDESRSPKISEVLVSDLATHI